MTQEILSENCKDEYNLNVRLVQLIGSPDLSRLEIIIYPPSADSKQNAPIRPSAYYKMISSKNVLSVLSNQNQNLGQITQNNTKYIPYLRITYDDNVAGWYVPHPFGSIEKYLLQRLHELSFIGSNKKILNGKNIFEGVKNFDNAPFLKASLKLFRVYCHRKGYNYEKRNPPEVIDIKSHMGQRPYIPLSGKPGRY